MAQEPNPLNDLFSNWAYTYKYWFAPMLKAFSPTLNFGCNIEDAGVEQHVLGEVGSYGKQMNRVLDVLTVLVSRADLGSLTPEEKDHVDSFNKLANAADRATREYQNEQPSGVTMADLDRLMDEIANLEHRNPAAYAELQERARERMRQMEVRSRQTAGGA